MQAMTKNGAYASVKDHVQITGNKRRSLLQIYRLPAIFIIAWLLILWWGERLAFQRQVNACAWEDWEDWVGDNGEFLHNRVQC